VQACNAAGCAGWSATQSTSVLLPPPTPATISVPSTSSGAVSVGWASASTATSYTLQHQLNGGSWSTVFTGNATSTSVSETTSGSYAYRVEACNGGGCGAYKASGTVTVTIPPASAPSLSAPSSSNTGSYTVSWTGVSGATSYNLQEQVNSGAWSTIYSGTTLSDAMSGHANGTYGYRVQACNAGGCSGWSAIVSVTVLFPPTVPQYPLTLTSDSTNKVIGISWSAISTATSYQLQEVDPSGVDNVLAVGSATSTSVSATVSGTYRFNLKACNSGGCSAWSSWQSTTITIYTSTGGGGVSKN